MTGTGADEIRPVLPDAADWPTAAAWLASDRSGGLAVQGVPLAQGAVTPSRYDLAPGAIRDRLARLSCFDGERGVDLRGVPVRDEGDALEPVSLASPLTCFLGGHNGVTWEVLRRQGDLSAWGLLTLDAHHDVRPYEGDRPGNGSPVRAAICGGLPGANVVQVGIAGFSNSPVHRRWCEEQGVAIFGPGSIGDVPTLLDRLASRCSAIYVDIDVDVLDRAFAPGCPGARPGGLRPRELFGAVFAAGAHPAVKVVDIVEVDPVADVAHLSVDAAALCLLNVASGFARRS